MDTIRLTVRRMMASAGWAAATAVMLAATATSQAQTQVNAADFGWNADDAFAALQGAVDSGADVVYVPNMGTPWILGDTLRLQSNQTLLLERGVVVQAKRGEFHHNRAALVRIENKSNVSIIGHGAVFEMWQQDYANPALYTPSEGRHGIRATDATNLIIEGITVRNTGGDGIYLGDNSGDNGKVNHNVAIRNVNLHNNLRQGVSVISVDGLMIESSIFHETDGAWPQAGIDFEPNAAFNRIENITLRNNIFHANVGSGVMMYLFNLDDPSGTTGVVANNTIVNNGQSGNPTFRSGIATFHYLPEWTFQNNLIVDNTGWGMSQLDDGASKTTTSYTAFWNNQLGAMSNVAAGEGVLTNARPVFVSTDVDHPYYMWLTEGTDPALLTAAANGGVVGARGFVGAPQRARDPVSAFLLDGVTQDAGDAVRDSFGGQAGRLTPTADGTPALPISSPGTPFSYDGNRSLESQTNDMLNTGYVSWENSELTRSLDGASAVSFQVWAKFESLLPDNSIFSLAGAALRVDGDGHVIVAGRSRADEAEQQATSRLRWVAPGQWNHIVGVLDFENDAIRIAINGAPFEAFDADFASAVLEGTGFAGTVEELFSRLPTHRYVGGVDEFALWDVALTQEEVLWLHGNSLKTVPEPGTFAVAVGLGGLMLTKRCRNRGEREN